MKRILIGLIAFVALAGMLNCVVLEPAHAYNEDKVVSDTSDDSECCFFCCSVHYQWLPSTPSLKVLTRLFAMLFIPSAFSFTPDPPTGSIFHPPQVL